MLAPSVDGAAVSVSPSCPRGTANPPSIKGARSAVRGVATDGRARREREGRGAAVKSPRKFSRSGYVRHASHLYGKGVVARRGLAHRNRETC